MNDKKLVDVVAKVLQDRDNEMGECYASWNESLESARGYYRRSAKKVIPIIREEIKRELEKIAYNASDGTWRIIPPEKWQDFWENRGVK